jgi:hypothetical protein
MIKRFAFAQSMTFIPWKTKLLPPIKILIAQKRILERSRRRRVDLRRMSRVECADLSREVSAIMQLGVHKVYFDSERRHYVVINDRGAHITSFKNWDGAVKNKLRAMGYNIRNESATDNIRTANKRREAEDRNCERIASDVAKELSDVVDTLGIRNAVSFTVNKG